MARSTFSLVVILTFLASSALAHTALNFPNPRGPKKSYAFQNPGNACENTVTTQTEKTVFKRGDQIPVSWWWNNHQGGFVKFALIQSVTGNVDNAAFLRNQNIIGGQCYTGGCDQKGKDNGFTHLCKGKPMELPNWVSDGEYTLQFSHIGGYHSDKIDTKQLPLYHNCANIKVEGGVAVQPRPADWIAPFQGGSQDKLNGTLGGNDVCGFKRFRAEPANPKDVDVNKDVRVNNMQFGVPDGWAVAGKTNKKRNDALRLPRLGRIARGKLSALSERDDEIDEDGHFEPANEERDLVDLAERDDEVDADEDAEEQDEDDNDEE